MSIKLGNSNIALKVGSSAVTAAYLGSTLVYSGGTPPTPTSYTYSVTIQGLENGDTTTIFWCDEDWSGFKADYNVGNGTYTASTANTTVIVRVSDYSSDYTVDHNDFELYSGGSQTVTFTYQGGGGGGGLVQIPYGTDMSQYVGQSIKRLVIGDASATSSTSIYCNYWADTLTINQWGVYGQGQFSSITSLPIDITFTNAALLNNWDDGSGSNHNNIFNDLQIEWA